MTPIASAASASAATTATSGSGATGGAQIAGNFQSFLTLLTTQLKNQSPLDPLDTNQFTQQLVQFASVEQQLKTNEQLTALLAASKSSATATAANYIGMSVTADGSAATLSGGKANWTLNAPKAAKAATITIKDADGAVVSTRTTTLSAGTQSYAWDGRNAAGTTQPDGEYTLSVTAVDAAGQALAVSTEISGTVSAVNVSGVSPVLTVGSATVPLAKVRTVSKQ